MKTWDRVVKYRSPYLYDLPSSKATPALTSQVVCVVVDGLRVDTSLKMESFKRLRKVGAEFVAVTGQPSLSDPGAAVLASGTYQEIHGVTTNWYKALLKVDSVLLAAKRVGLVTGVAGGKGYSTLHGKAIDVERYFQWDDKAPSRYDDQVAAATTELLTMTPKVNFMFVHFSETDNAAHAYGGASREFEKAAMDIDRRIVELLGRCDLSKTTVIVTSDHGHIDTGGHGGWEKIVLEIPVVMAGPGIKPGKYAAAGQADLAPTMAALLGAPIPAHATGKVLDQVLAASAETASRILTSEAEQKQAFYAKYLASLRASPAPVDHLKAARDLLAAGNWQATTAAAKEQRSELEAAGIVARGKAMGTDRAARLPAVLAMALIPLVALWWLRRGKTFRAALAAAALYFLVYNALFFGLHRYYFSLSTFNEEGLIKAYFNGRMVEAAVAVLIAAVVYGFFAGRVTNCGLEVATGGVILSGLVWYGLLLQVLLMFWLYGIEFAAYLPDLKIGFKFYLDMLQMVAAGFAAVLVPALAFLASLAGRAVRRAAPAAAAPGND
jgi:hypothetical protein